MGSLDISHPEDWDGPIEELPAGIQDVWGHDQFKIAFHSKEEAFDAGYWLGWKQARADLGVGRPIPQVVWHRERDDTPQPSDDLWADFDAVDESSGECMP
jgi:hypothetical protein